VTAVIAHRGDWLEGPGPLPQNSVAAVLQALDAGADGAEVDARMTADGVIVLHHDARLGADDAHAGCRLPSGTAICDARASEVGHLGTLSGLLEALAEWAGRGGGAGEDAPVLNVELKDLPGEPGWDAGYRLVHDVARLLVEAGAGEWPGPRGSAPVRVIVSSFDPVALAELRRLSPGLAAGLLLAPGADWRAALPGAVGLRAVNPADADGGPELFAAASAAGLAVLPWTVDDPVRAAALAAMGAAGVITNRPRSVLAALGRS
jgi:glycerophosphoryl diester phosphodiesterase